MVSTSPCSDRCCVWTLPPGLVLIFIQRCFNTKCLVSRFGNGARYLLPTSIQGRSLPVSCSQVPTCFSSLALWILSALWHNFNRKGWEVAYSLGRDRWIWISLRRKRTQTQIQPLLREVLQPLRYYTKTTTPIICILSSAHTAVSWGFGSRAGLTPRAGFRACKCGSCSWDAAKKLEQGMGGRRVPGITIGTSTESSVDKIHGGNKTWEQAQKELQGLPSGGWKLLAGSRHKNRYTGSSAKSLANDNWWQRQSLSSLQFLQELREYEIFHVSARAGQIWVCWRGKAGILVKGKEWAHHCGLRHVTKFLGLHGKSMLLRQGNTAVQLGWTPRYCTLN